MDLWRKGEGVTSKQRFWAKNNTEMLYSFMIMHVKMLMALKKEYFRLVDEGKLQKGVIWKRKLDKINKALVEHTQFLVRNLGTAEMKYIMGNHTKYKENIDALIKMLDELEEEV